jgi:hypothetical protein
VSTGDVERDHYAIAGFDVSHLRTHLFDDPHRLVAEDVTLADERAQHLVQLRVRAADARRRDLDDRVSRLLDRGIRDSVDADVPLAVKRQGLDDGVLSKLCAAVVSRTQLGR